VTEQFWVYLRDYRCTMGTSNHSGVHVRKIKSPWVNWFQRLPPFEMASSWHDAVITLFTELLFL